MFKLFQSMRLLHAIPFVDKTLITRQHKWSSFLIHAPCVRAEFGQTHLCSYTSCILEFLPLINFLTPTKPLICPPGRDVCRGLMSCAGIASAWTMVRGGHRGNPAGQNFGHHPLQVKLKHIPTSWYTWLLPHADVLLDLLLNLISVHE